MKIQAVRLTFLALVSTLVACASSPTEQSFGNAVRATMAEQRVYPAPQDGSEEPGMDGPRAEAVLSTYRKTIGSPTSVVGGQAVERE